MNQIILLCWIVVIAIIQIVHAEQQQHPVFTRSSLAKNGLEINRKLSNTISTSSASNDIAETLIKAAEQMRIQSKSASASSSSSLSTSSKRGRTQSKLASFYHTTIQIYDEITALKPSCPHMTINWEKGPSKSLMTVRINKQDENKTVEKERILLFFGEHARELISVETGLELIRLLCLADSNKSTQIYDENHINLNDILAHNEFLIFPNANPYGRRRVERGDYCLRSNNNGVDLNRNWGNHWSNQQDHEDTYPGKKPFSEEETVILARTTIQFKPSVFISIHSGTLSMLSPVAHTLNSPGEPGVYDASKTVNPPNVLVPAPLKDGLDGLNVKPVLNIMKKVNQNFCKCTYGAAGRELGYLCPGTCLDYIYNRLGIRYAFAVEIYSGRQGFCKKKSRNFSFLEHNLSKEEIQKIEQAEEKSRLQELTELESCFFQKQKPTIDHAFLQASSSSSSLSSISTITPPSFSEKNSQLLAVPDNQSDDNVYSGVMYPVPVTQKHRQCLHQFNPLDEKKYVATVDHWSRALLAFVHEARVEKASYF